MEQEKVIVIDFGGQYNQLVARRVRECNVYCEIYSYRTDIEQIRAMKPKGIILTGGPNSCYEADSPTCTGELFGLGIPVLGLCYGAQLMNFILGGRVEKAPVREYGRTEVFVNPSSSLFEGVGTPSSAPVSGKTCDAHKSDTNTTVCWMSHTDYISQAAPDFRIVAHTADCPVAAAENPDKKLYAIQFHPEVLHTAEGSKMLANFVHKICGCGGTWRMDSFVEQSVEELRKKVGDGRVLLALSGGVDSSVAAGLLARAIGKQLTCVFVDHGLLRKDEGDEVEAVFGEKGQFDLNFIRVNAQQRYYDKLAGVTEPEKKRKIIGGEFIRVFEEEAKKIGTVEFLAQGTIYPDVVESGLGGESAVIKSHHNVGGLPDTVDFKEILEPLRNLFKDEVRKAGLELGLPEHLVFRQPFPGPGLGIRVIGEVTAEKVRIVQDADAIYREELARAAEAYEKQNGAPAPWKPDQYFAALTNMRSVGVMGDERTYDYAV
ncbi:MAG: glutamine-hydrolyzing GMP synthase, partial [Blautia sp.]|nr:glutamine-hydrolyzing GMP synthase [Blautia sp.]